MGVGLALALSPPPAQAQTFAPDASVVTPTNRPTWRRGDPVLVADPPPLVTPPKTTGMPLAVIRTDVELTLGVGQTLHGCGTSARDCTSRLGWSGNIALFHRPLAWFSWGASLDTQSLSQRWRAGELEWRHDQQLWSGRLLARVHSPERSAFDPYVAVSLGGAALATRARASNGESSTPAWLGSPLYGARVGFNVHVGTRLSLGAFGDWTSVQTNTGETCPWKVGGVCSSQNWSAFPPAGAIWNVVASASFAFGREL